MIDVKIQNKTVKADANSLLSDILKQSCSPDMPCGGRGVCGKCRVVAKGNLSPMTNQEKKHLSDKEISKGVRLACLTRALGDCEIEIDNQIKTAKIAVDFTLPDIKTNPLFSKYGVAVDIGTTTIVAVLYDKNGEVATEQHLNPQQTFGADVITRIEFALGGGLCEIGDCITTKLSEIINTLCLTANINASMIDAVVIVGNTTMLYLLTGSDPKSLSCAPFEADRLFGENISAKQLSLPCENATVYLTRCVSAFVGADIVSAIIASNMGQQDDVSILADIGTNGELTLLKDNTFYCCSTAAGPAFEGRGLYMGMGAASGAINKVSVENDEIKAEVIGNGKAVGICGSGVVDAVAGFLSLELIDETGRISEGESVVVSGEVVLTQKDIRSIQLAKSAIFAGIETLVAVSNLTYNDIKTLYIAGGFGSYLDIGSAAAIGLIPRQLESKANVVGNAALCGAVMMLLDKDFIDKSEEIAKKAQTVDLATSKIFIDAYTEGMFFE